jgi:hypothetical protein
MKTSVKIAFLTFASITALAVVFGAYFLATAVIACAHLTIILNEMGPYISRFVVLYSAINLCFLIMLGKSAFRLFRFNVAGVSLLSLSLKLELLYLIIISFAWLLPSPLGMSAAGATGIGNMGIAPQLVIAYPLTGLLALWILKKLKMLNVQPPVSASLAPLGG